MAHRTTARSAFGVQYFALIWLSGLIWHLTRWGVAFLGTFLINEMTGSPRLVQLAGTLLYAPLLVGGVLGGMVSDRFDRIKTVRAQLLLLAPLTVGVGLLVSADRTSLWIIYPFMFTVGVGWVTDMTCRRALIYDLVGEANIDDAMAMEALSLSLGIIFGALVGGSAVEAVGIGPSYLVLAGLLVVAFALLAPVRVAHRSHRAEPPVAPDQGDQVSGPAAVSTDGTGGGFRTLRAQRGLTGVLGVTAIANFFLFSYFPIVPVVAERLDATPFLVGLLAAGTGIGMMTGSLAMARLAPVRRGLFYTLGLLGALIFVVPFGRGTEYWFVLAAIICSGIGSGLFGSTQTTLVMAAVPPELRGRALGLLSMAIGTLPIGMYALGELAERIGVDDALTTNAVVGSVALGLWTLRRPEVRRMSVAYPTPPKSVGA